MYFYKVNGRSIKMYFYGAFNGYNTTTYNNGNDITIFGQGYYSLYGLTLYCTTDNSNCIVDCYGNNCVGLTIICSDNTLVCTYKCSDSQCIMYQHLIVIKVVSMRNNNIDHDNKVSVSVSYGCSMMKRQFW